MLWLLCHPLMLVRRHVASEGSTVSRGVTCCWLGRPQSLSFARAASVVRACSYKIAPHTPPEALAALPFIGAARARQISDLATKGTTAELEQHRCGAAPRLRPGHQAAPSTLSLVLLHPAHPVGTTQASCCSMIGPRSFSPVVRFAIHAKREGHSCDAQAHRSM